MTSAPTHWQTHHVIRTVDYARYATNYFMNLYGAKIMKEAVFGKVSEKINSSRYGP
jgi:hypothetical protein